MRYRVHDNNEFLFIPSGESTPPKRWKQWLPSILAVFPLIPAIPPPFYTLAPRIPGTVVLPITAATISAFIVYWMMPPLSR